MNARSSEQVRFGWREGLALLCALGRGAVESDPKSDALPVRALARVAACHRVGGLDALGELPRHQKERLLVAETKATRAALARLGDLGLVVWDYSVPDNALTYRLTGLGQEAALLVGRRGAKHGPVAFGRTPPRRQEAALAAG